MTCEQIRRQLALSRPGGEDSVEVVAHLADCSGCRKVAAEHRQIWKALARFEVPPVPAALAGEITRLTGGDEIAIRREIAGASRGRAVRLARGFIVAAAAVVLLGAGLGGWIGWQAHTAMAAEPAPVTSDEAAFFGIAPPGSLNSAYAMVSPEDAK